MLGSCGFFVLTVSPHMDIKFVGTRSSTIAFAGDETSVASLSSSLSVAVLATAAVATRCCASSPPFSTPSPAASCDSQSSLNDTALAVGTGGRFVFIRSPQIDFGGAAGSSLC